ncbi:phytoene/squalene synthase family protein [Fulvimarina sp. 2208YS6-2-32]|uniref:Phytoene/squalene synthase family protein n=1 Tax=Fulvimarina uroteuthidis TaxID=3098149 RepID=A0ABU5I672_9HYPH|nr:phytoene/squalene synthase family protein [Fulvimarina sp. 2208YS6-2-32]MDY8110592.1 phytoene/squalene synthase family protein [Fulvimarina sp. 2208YS6-2-32]
MADAPSRIAAVKAPESLALIEREDRDRALALEFVTPDKREALAALYAFDLETARIRDLVSQPLPGEIRLQWWRDLIGSGERAGSGHPIADELLAVIDRHDLPRSVFERFLDARVFDLYDDPFSTTADFEAYAGETRSTLIMLAAMVLSKSDAGAISDAAGHAGVAETCRMALKTLAASRRRGQCLIPLDILAAVGCSADDLVKGERDATKRAVAAFCAYGRDHDAKWRRRFGAVPRSVRAAFLPPSLSDATFAAALKSDLSLEETLVEPGPIRKSWRYWRMMRA